jgi:hypothetical protein
MKFKLLSHFDIKYLQVKFPYYFHSKFDGFIFIPKEKHVPRYMLNSLEEKEKNKDYTKSIRSQIQ